MSEAPTLEMHYPHGKSFSFIPAKHEIKGENPESRKRSYQVREWFQFEKILQQNPKEFLSLIARIKGRKKLSLLSFVKYCTTIPLLLPQVLSISFLPCKKQFQLQRDFCVSGWKVGGMDAHLLKRLSSPES